MLMENGKHTDNPKGNGVAAAAKNMLQSTLYAK
jgi:hypothetical protein